jgi:outer membrane protein OmpA-like peptidoglycan-associated protein
MKLSDQRAKSVMNVLVTKYGIAQSRLTAKGYGQTKPVDTNKTPAGKAKNRRVEAVKTK